MCTVAHACDLAFSHFICGAQRAEHTNNECSNDTNASNMLIVQLAEKPKNTLRKLKRNFNVWTVEQMEMKERKKNAFHILWSCCEPSREWSIYCALTTSRLYVLRRSERRRRKSCQNRLNMMHLCSTRN